MKRLSASFVILLPAVVVVGCTGAGDTTGATAMRPDTPLGDLRERVLAGWGEEEALLAIKYGLDSATVAGVVRGYLSEQDDFVRFLGPPSSEGPGAEPTVAETVDSLANAYGVEPSVVGAMLFDFRLARALRELEDANAGR